MAGYNPKNKPTAAEKSVAIKMASKPTTGTIFASLAAAICPTMKAINVKLDKEQQAILDQVKAATKLKTSDVIRQLLIRFGPALAERMTANQ